MAKIIGQDPDSIATCGHCGAVVQFTQADIWPGEKITDSEYDYGDYRNVVECPKCKNTMVVKGFMTADEAEQFLRNKDDI